ncbi:RING-type E3 ubiquitin transferase [Trifolium repens]|nr:RING-type E3 ubiquitin transferase [Trifolium repens]
MNSFARTITFYKVGHLKSFVYLHSIWLSFTRDHSYDIYSFKLYPSVFSVICAPVGTFVDADGTKVLVVGASIDEPYYVVLEEANFILITESCIRQMGRRFQEVMSEWIVKLNNIEIDDSSAIYQTNSLS